MEGNVDVKTTDGYTLRMFAIGFTTKMPNQVSKMCYANSAQVRQIRKKMVDVMREEASKCDLKDLVETHPGVHGRRDREKRARASSRCRTCLSARSRSSRSRNLIW